MIGVKQGTAEGGQSLESAAATRTEPVSPPTPGWAVRVRARARLLGVLVVLLALLLGLRSFAVSANAAELDEALGLALQQQGLRVDPTQIRWLEDQGGLLWARPVVFVASGEGELPDVYYAEVRTVGRASIVDLWFLSNITRSSSAAEGQLRWIGPLLAYAARVGETFDAVVVLDPRGESGELTEQWSRRERLQNFVSNLQETGRGRGFGRARYRLVPSALSLSLDSEGGRLVAVADGQRVEIEPASGEVHRGADRVSLHPREKAKPGLITWLVDTVRNVSFIGPEPIAWLEHTVFGLTDRASRVYHGVVEVDTEAEVAAAMAVPQIAPEKKALLVAAAPSLGWPPPALQPQLGKPAKGEGEWLPIVDDPFVNSYPNAPPAFVQTFLRIDPERAFTRVYFTMWDPRQVQLDIAMGTREPESATGETGSGMIPREPELLKRLVAGFNGGFQALHGEFGMMAEDRVYLPPKPWAATVAVFEDGRVGMGSWPGPGRGGWDEEIANQQIPDSMVAMRQNLTSVVEDGEYNPWKRWWWGAAPAWAKEQTYIHRSGLCLTEEGFMAYLWGESMGPEELGKAMLAARCVRGMHLDMNSKHTGLEFYRPIEPGQAPQDLGRKLTDHEFEGDAPEMQGFRFRVRKAITTMTPLRFPRYLGRDPRDYFYLHLKPVLPGPDLRIGTRTFPFETEGLPNAGWPHAFARLRLAGEGGQGSWLVRIDASRAVPTTVLPQPAPQPDARVLAQLTAVGEPEQGVALFARRVRGRLSFGVGAPPSDAQVVLWGPPLERVAQTASAAIGVDPDGFLVYAEASPQDVGSLAQRLQTARVDRAVALPPEGRLAFAAEGKQLAVDGLRQVRAGARPGLAFVAETAPAAEVLFPEVRPRPYRFWGWLQGKRVRYFPEHEPRFKTPEEAL